jgi:oligosaccharide repeat unit polymerase
MWPLPESVSWNAVYILDVLAIFHFALSYYRDCYRKDYRVDIWHTQLFVSFVFPNMLMLPFAKSELNALVVGRDMGRIVEVLPTVFLITMVGYFAVLAGGGLWRLKAGLGMRKAAVRVLDIVPQCSMMLMSSRRVLIFQSALCVVLQGLILSFYFSQDGFGFNLRDYTFANPTLRPVALVISRYSIIIASACLARYIDTKERILLVCTLSITFGLIFFGTRGNILGIYLAVLVCYLVKRRSSISLLRIASVALGITILAFYLGSVRYGEYSLTAFATSFFMLLFFGNNFSDLRDFAWVYSGWDHVPWGGKTYLAAVLSFVPRFASQFRDTWGMGVATDLTAGLDPQVHPGLRPGAFGESFFNFGLIGVIAIGLMLGIVLRRVDTDVKVALASSRLPMTRAFASTALLGVALTLTITAEFSGLYVLAGVYVFSWFCICVERMFRPRQILLEVANEH